jgi:hypothetical protein
LEIMPLKKRTTRPHGKRSLSRAFGVGLQVGTETENVPEQTMEPLYIEVTNTIEGSL